MSFHSQKKEFVIESLLCGVLLTAALTFLAFMGNSRAWGCTFAWQACLVQRVIHTPQNEIGEATPIDLFAFVFGVFLGVPIYSILYYTGRTYWQKRFSKVESK